MQVYHQLAQFTIPDFAVVTSGTFDGVHLGHQRIFQHLRQIAAPYQGEIVVITFWPHPRIVLSEGKANLQLLSTIEEKTELLAEQGVNHLLILPFTEQFSQLSPEQFVEQVYIKGVGAKKLVIGYDHRFGKDRAGGIEYLRANATHWGYEVEEIAREDIDDVGVSSTKIRKALLEGDIITANKYLGRTYSLTGIVSRGQQIGRTIGFPTANLYIKEPYKLIPYDGIFAIKAKVRNSFYKAMLYIGKRPTIQNTPPERSIEVHIFDFEEQIYGEELTIFFIQKIREDQTFESLEKMQQQLQADELRAKEILQDY